jgi:hypothetical protein
MVLSTIQQPLTPFEYASFPIDDSLVSTEKGISLAVSITLWHDYPLATILLALLLFLTSACCASLLAPKNHEKGVRN